jgi:hypothetical protein
MNKRSTPRARRERSGIEMKSLGRLVRYLTRYPRQAALPYLFLIVASLSQLAVPRMVRNIIDAVSSGVIAQGVMDNLARVPAAIMPVALPKILAALGLPAGWSLDQLMAEMTQRLGDAPSALLTAASRSWGLPRCAACSPSCRSTGRSATRRTWPSNCATTCSPRSSAYHFPITTAIRPGNSWCAPPTT